MYSYLRFSLGFLLIVTIVTPLTVNAESEFGERFNASVCKNEMLDALAREQRQYRSIIFGEPPASGATIGHVRFDLNYHPFIKVGENTWRTTASGRTAITFRDTDIELTAEFPTRRGIFDTPRTLTSELVPYLTQAIRAFDCRTQAWCSVPGQGIDDGDLVTIRNISGCDEIRLPALPTCNEAMDFPDIPDTRSYCEKIQPNLVNREIALLKMATEYDAAYRTLLQFAGDFDSFLREFRFPFTNTLKKASQLIGQFQRIPCFSSSCDEFPEDPYIPSTGTGGLPDPFPPIGDLPGEKRAANSGSTTIDDPDPR